MKTITIIILAACIYSCNSSTQMDIEKNKNDIYDTDTAFSNLSAKKGMKAAFLQYMDSATTLLRPNHYPIVGTDAANYLKNINDSLFTLIWAPKEVQVAASCDLGYSYGIYTYHDKDTIFNGTYVSIWKKQANGSWKFVLDTGNEGVGNKK